MRIIAGGDPLAAFLAPDEPDRPAEPARTRPITYLLSQPVDEGTLVLNTLTRAAVVLEHHESLRSRDLRAELCRMAFLVEESADDAVLMRQLDLLARTREDITDQGYREYTVFTTTACNARCFYCFEEGVATVDMTPATAQDVAQFILDTRDPLHCTLSWFGGEPLCNTAAIDAICARLNHAGARFSSTITTNGLLLDPATLRRAVGDWHLVSAQFTLDGLGDEFNRRKAFVDPGCDPFRRVVANMDAAMDRGVYVGVRLNADLGNTAHLHEMLDWLHARHAGNPHMAAVRIEPLSQLRRTADRARLERIYGILEELEDHAYRLGLHSPATFAPYRSSCRCAADSPRSTAILPDGTLHGCRDAQKLPPWGRLGGETRKSADELAAWREPLPDEAGCTTCPCRPACDRRARCVLTAPACVPAYRRLLERRLLHAATELYRGTARTRKLPGIMFG